MCFFVLCKDSPVCADRKETQDTEWDPQEVTRMHNKPVSGKARQHSWNTCNTCVLNKDKE